MSWIEKHRNTLKLAILVFAYAYLLYKLITFDNYQLLISQWTKATAERWWWIMLTLLLLPLNWSLEAMKWRSLVGNLEKLSFAQSLSSVLVGTTTGFFTPNRLGEYPGRTLLLSDGNRLTATTMGFVGSAALTICILMIGIPSSVIFATYHTTAFSFSHSIYIYFLLSAVVFGVGFFFLPRTARLLLSKKTFGSKSTQLLQTLGKVCLRSMLHILLLSLLRYAVFCTQLLAMIHFFGVEISLWESIVGITASYLFVTLTPSVAFAEVAVRGSWAIVFLGTFSANTVGIASASISLWAINYCIPMIIGSLVLPSFSSQKK